VYPVLLWCAACAVLLVVACSGPPADLVRTPRPLVYVAIGASDAVGVGAVDPARDGWVPVLHRRLPVDARLVNLGISGSLLREALVQQLPVALDANPDLVTVWLAVNDFAAQVPLEEYCAGLDQLLDAITTQTHARVLVANVPDLTQVPVFGAVPRDLLEAEILRWNAAIADVVDRHGAVLVDLYPFGAELAGRPELVGGDGFHPSTRGYRRLAEVMWAAVEAHQLLP
jgi:acyl-CoA thioesterase-1